MIEFTTKIPDNAGYTVIRSNVFLQGDLIYLAQTSSYYNQCDEITSEVNYCAVLKKEDLEKINQSVSAS